MLKIVSPCDGAVVSSPLLVVKLAHEGLTVAELRVNGARHVLELDRPEVTENVTLLEGENRIEVSSGGESHAVTVQLPPVEAHLEIDKPGPRTRVCRERAMRMIGYYNLPSVAAGVLSCNGAMQQLAIEDGSRRFSEKVILGPGDNHLAVQLGGVYATRLLRGDFSAARVVVTLQWDSPKALDLWILDSRGRLVSSKLGDPSIYISRRIGFGPISWIANPDPGSYTVYLRLSHPNPPSRSEWIVTVLADEGQPTQSRRRFYGIYDRWSYAWNVPMAEIPGLPGRARWSRVCEIRVGDRIEVA
jgi:hypothetical protein